MYLRPSDIGAEAELAELLGTVADFPRPGITFFDIGPLLADGPALSRAVAAMARPFLGEPITKVVGVEARGLILGAPVALALSAGFVPLRKAGKLPGPTVGVDYDLEYGCDRLEIQAGKLCPQDRVLLVDDVLATGGTAGAACRLVAQTGAQLAGIVFLLELTALAGRARLPEGIKVVSILGR
jgi:adenine phosphoribosyltransferase